MKDLIIQYLPMSAFVLVIVGFSIRPIYKFFEWAYKRITAKLFDEMVESYIKYYPGYINSGHTFAKQLEELKEENKNLREKIDFNYSVHRSNNSGIDSRMNTVERRFSEIRDRLTTLEASELSQRAGRIQL